MVQSKLTAVILAVLLVLTVFGPATIGTAAAAGNDGLSIGVSQGANTVTVSVSNSSDGSPIVNASVTIESDGDYNASGMTDTNGVATFDAPNETVNATVTAEKNGTSASKMVTIQGSEGDGPKHTPLGQMVSAYVHGLLAGDDITGPIGLLVSDFASSNAGPPDHAGPDNEDEEEAENEEESEEEDDDRGPPEDAGPPDHAGPDDKADDDGEDDNSGPPDHAGPP